MAHIQSIPEGLPGIRGLMAYRPETAKPLNLLAEVLLRDNDNSLSKGERELIATYVSYLNDCYYCQHSHGAMAQYYLKSDPEFIERFKHDFRSVPISDKMKSLLAIAASVQKGGKHVTPEQVAEARRQSASDREIHDTVLIAAAFCMYNRYVDGLGTWAPADPEGYQQRAEQRAKEGYGQFDPTKQIHEKVG
jgi:uncharacterized peroxidase-related enzyme